MSGGSYDYSYCKVEEFANALRTNDNPRRLAFAKLCRLVAKAMHDIEWVDSDDDAPGNENKAIDAVFEEFQANIDSLYKAAAYDKIKAIVDTANKEYVEKTEKIDMYRK